MQGFIFPWEFRGMGVFGVYEHTGDNLNVLLEFPLGPSYPWVFGSK